MTSNYLQEIRDLLEGIAGSISDISLLGEIVDTIREIDDLIESINSHTETSNNNEAEMIELLNAIKSQNISQAQLLYQYYQLLNRINTGVDNTHVINIENDVDNMNTNLSSLLNHLGTIISLLNEMKIDLFNNKENIEAIANNTQAIAGNTGGSLAFLEDIATNTLNSYNRETSIAADTTEIIALLRRLVDKVDPTVSEITNSLRNQRINPGERKLFVVDFSDILPEGYRISGIRGLNFTPGNEPLQPGESRQYQALDNRGFTTTGNGTKYQVAVYNYADSIVQFTLTVSAMIIKAD